MLYVPRPSSLFHRIMAMNFHIQRATAALAVALSLSVASCASSSDVAPRVNSLVVAQKLDQAVQTLGDNPNSYGKNNQLLYWLDRGMVEQCAGHYQESIHAFAEAQRRFDELYTKSITKLASAWALNDYAAPYRGEDFEYTLVNIFQAVNYVMLGQYNEALVEARDMDSKLNLVNALYAGKNMYKEDAFGRFLMGILYEVNGSGSDLNDAYISYVKAYDDYVNDFQKNYGIEAPAILKENLLTLAHFMGAEEFAHYRREFSGIPFISLEDKKKKAEVYLVQYVGFSPVKISFAIPIPVDVNHVTQISFPKYITRYSEISSSEFIASKGEQLSFVQPAQVGQNIEALAMKLLEYRRVQIFAKSVIRPAVKYAAEKFAGDAIEKKYGETTADVFNVLTSIYNLSTERADLRSWQTLPAQIRISRLLLEPDEYEFFVQTYEGEYQPLNKVSLGKMKLSAGDKKFLVFRNYR